MCTSEGQQIVWDTWQSSLHLYPETQLHKDIEEMHKVSGRDAIEIDLAWEAAHPEFEGFADKIAKILATAGK